MNVVDSPPGMTRPSSPASSSALRTSTTSTPSPRSICACSRKLPCTARTPIRTGCMEPWYRRELPLLRSQHVPAAVRALGPAREDEPLEMRERLGHREPALTVDEVGREELERDLPRVHRGNPERGF